ncbi:uncharacterized protein LOC120796431 isoform X2 [Xiphias gladius]|nr:uncharacterized protein LOC120796431 isoform X2 [Xiphias gladius]
MSDPENTTQPLLRAPSQQTAVDVGAPAQGGRSSRAYKVAGLTVLACVLVMSQAMIAYFLLSQRSDIKSLEEQSNNLKTELTKGRSVSVPMRLPVPMNALPRLMVDTVGEEDSITIPGKTVPQEATDCQLEAAGVKAVQVPGFRPECDERGLYQAQQCYMYQCWCVNPANGEQIPGSQRDGQAKCSATVLTGGLSKVFAVPNVDV